MKTAEQRMEALLKFLDDNTSADDVAFDLRDGYHMFTIGDREYYVLTDDEATALAEREADNSLWAFRAGYICEYLGITEHRTVRAIEKMQEELCEDADPIIRHMLTPNLAEFLSDAVATDGRGRFIACYDHEENEEGDFFIYRVN